MEKNINTRRKFLRIFGGIAAASLGSIAAYKLALADNDRTTENTEVNMLNNDEIDWMNISDREWRERLTAEEYRILRRSGTERAHTSELNHETRVGIFHCAGCDNELFASSAKFDSGTGWPSFYEPISDTAIGTSRDYGLFTPRTEEHCARCGGHLGHVFDDGPEPTGKRHCINGGALNFSPS